MKAQAMEEKAHKHAERANLEREKQARLDAERQKQELEKRVRKFEEEAKHAQAALAQSMALARDLEDKAAHAQSELLEREKQYKEALRQKEEAERHAQEMMLRHQTSDEEKHRIQQIALQHEKRAAVLVAEMRKKEQEAAEAHRMLIEAKRQQIAMAQAHIQASQEIIEKWVAV